MARSLLRLGNKKIHLHLDNSPPLPLRRASGFPSRCCATRSGHSALQLPRWLTGLAVGWALALACLPVRAQVSEFPLWSDPMASAGATYQGVTTGLEAGLTVGAGGVLYGCTILDFVFAVSPGGLGCRMLHNFRAAPDRSDDVIVESRLVMGSDGVLYGAAEAYGTNGVGAVFKINPDGTGYDVIHIFHDWQATYGLEVGSLRGITQGKDGVLYGVTIDDGGGPGLLYALDTDGTGPRVLHVFSGLDQGTDPLGPLVQGPDGALYGATRGGGTALGSWANLPFGGMIQNFGGTLFKINPDGTGYQLLHSFPDPSLFGNDGDWPCAGLTLGPDGALYGTTPIGGDNGAGTIFKINADGSGYVSYSLTNQSPAGLPGWPVDYNAPGSEMLLASDGAFYGTIQLGGRYNAGEVFRYDPVGMNFTEVYSFTTNSWDGQWPCGALVQGSDGALYGTTMAGGRFGYGTVFRLAAPGLGPDWRAPLLVSIAPLPGGAVQLDFGGALNCSCRLDASVNLVDWQPLAALSNTNGIMEYIDVDAVNYPHRFYRAVWLQ